MQPTDFTFASYLVRGTSHAGTGTCLTLPHLKLAIDTAQGLPFAYPMKHLFITHAHIDHAGGLAYIISQRGLMGLTDLKIYVAPDILNPLKTILNTWEKLEGFEYSYHLIPVMPGDEVNISDKHFVRPFSTVHRVPSQGYCLFEKNKSLKEEFKGQHPAKLAELRKQGVQLEDHFHVPVFAYTGDTQMEFLDSCDPEILKAKMFFIDCTYHDDWKSVTEAKKWGHIHVNEVVENIERFLCEKLVLTHASRKYKKSDLEQILSRLLPHQQLRRVTHFP